MTAHYCSDRGTWSLDSCPATCCGDPHKLRHVGPDKIVQMMNTIASAHRDLLDGDNCMEDLQACLDWMGDNE